MSRPGIGAMIHSLTGGSPRSASDYYGLIITSAKIVEFTKGRDGSVNELHLGFEDGTKIRIFDDGQSCCERRYMRSDDKVQDLVGQRLMKIEIKKADIMPDEDGQVHEIAFMEIKTDQGVTSFSFHVEHNGYYGGFGLSVDKIDSAVNQRPKKNSTT